MRTFWITNTRAHNLFPTVFGVEAMAQAVAYVLGRPDIGCVTINGLDLPRPLPVHAERGLGVEISARVLETRSGVINVLTSVRCEQTGYSVDHFSATFALGVQSAPTKAGDLLDLQGSSLKSMSPQEQLYGPILFQGPRFQRIQGVRHLDSRCCGFESEEREAHDWVLGDPFARDALLQSLQLCALPDQCLPVHVNRWHIADARLNAMRSRENQATITAHTEDAYVGDVVSSDDGGSVLEEISGYRAKILKRRDDWPTAEEFADGSFRQNSREETLEWSTSAAYQTIEGAGPQGQPLFIFRFPLAFKDSATPMNSLYFNSFAEWMGRARELAGMGQTKFHPRLFEIFGEGTFGGVTNLFETTIVGRAGYSDVVEGRFWMDDCSDTDYTASCEWRRIPYPSGKAERIALTKMRTSAVKILRHGVARPAPWPEDFHEYLIGMGPTRASRKDLEPLPSSLKHLELDAPIWTAGENSASAPVAREVFSTSLQDSNLVGNLYFSNYTAWQGRLRDRFLYDILPECFQADQLAAQPECLYFSTHHLREAMPFDNIEVQMSLKSVYPSALDLWFEYYRVDMAGSRDKLAVGEHRVGLVSSSDQAPALVPWPAPAEARLRRVLDIIDPTTAASEIA